MRGDLGAARTQLLRATGDPRARGVAWTRLGSLELQAGRAVQAAAAFERALAVEPGNQEALDGRGEAYRRVRELGPDVEH